MPEGTNCKVPSATARVLPPRTARDVPQGTELQGPVQQVPTPLSPSAGRDQQSPAEPRGRGEEEGELRHSSFG